MIPELLDYEKKSENDYLLYSKKVTVSRIISEVSVWSPIDISVESQPIEDIIEGIYKGGTKSEAVL